MSSDIRNRHKMSLKGIFNEYSILKMIKSKATIFGFIFSFTITSAIYLVGDLNLYYKVLCSITSTALSLFPNLLGFCIGGYALIIGTGNIQALRRITSPMQKYNDLSLYQILSSIFAMSIIIQCATLLFAYIINVFVNMNLVAISDKWGTYINIILIFTLMLLTVLSLILLYYTVINIFNFGQSIHFSIRHEEENNDSNNE